MTGYDRISARGVPKRSLHLTGHNHPDEVILSILDITDIGYFARKAIDLPPSRRSAAKDVSTINQPPANAAFFGDRHAVLWLCDPESGQLSSRAIRTLASGLLSLGPMILSNSQQSSQLRSLVDDFDSGCWRREVLSSQKAALFSSHFVVATLAFGLVFLFAVATCDSKCDGPETSREIAPTISSLGSGPC